LKTDETNPADWFLLARERLEAADAVRAARGACYSAVELLQEAIERYLKGYLIGKGWPLQRIHNLSTLLDAAIRKDARFKEFADLCEGLTAQFWEQHYPFALSS
jgi:HEPN domain-containing protein